MSKLNELSRPFPKIAPSIMAANYANLAKDISDCEESGIDILHLDVMDNEFVPNLTFGPDLVAAIRPYFSKVFDAHLMVKRPWDIAPAFIKAGVNHITIHTEICTDLKSDLKKIKDMGISVGIAINPTTPASIVFDVLGFVDLVLVMSVQPGFYGQKFIKLSLDKVRLLKEKKPTCKIQIDGGINVQNIRQCFDAGADIMVAGAAVFKGYIKQNIQSLKDQLK